MKLLLRAKPVRGIELHRTRGNWIRIVLGTHTNLVTRHRSVVFVIARRRATLLPAKEIRSALAGAHVLGGKPIATVIQKSMLVDGVTTRSVTAATLRTRMHIGTFEPWILVLDDGSRNDFTASDE